ncbi:MAG TPA: TylF/MycF/NovP-related O-methyltransferase, partial [Pyrinomonadaceae bacterium]|nr:TylF/MycF/NovP-related O-methyltransferase [Pyrinomonadaceae bacterium]
WYGSVIACLEQLYDHVAPGGVIQIDDYGHWAGARKAVHEFLDRRNLTSRLRYVDYSGRQLVKSV